MTPPSWEGYRNFESWRPERDPTTPHRFARARRDIANSFVTPMGAYTTPEMQRAMQTAGQEDLRQAEGQAYREDQADFNRQRGQQLQALAALSAPQLVQTGSTGTQRGGWAQTLGGLLGGAGSVLGGLGSMGLAF